MSPELPEKGSFKSLVKKIILWSVIAGGVIALFVPVFVKSTLATEFALGTVTVRAEQSPCELFGGDRCVGGENVGKNLAESGKGTDNALYLIFDVIEVLIYLSAAVAVLFFIWGGYLILASGGDQAREKQGRDTLRNALIGMVIIILSTAIVAVVQRVVLGSWLF